MVETENSSWIQNVKKNDYVEVVSNTNSADIKLRQVTKVTENSIFVSKLQFSKETSIQRNNKRRIKPFMAHHKNTHVF